MAENVKCDFVLKHSVVLLDQDVFCRDPLLASLSQCELGCPSCYRVGHFTLLTLLTQLDTNFPPLKSFKSNLSSGNYEGLVKT